MRAAWFWRSSWVPALVALAALGPALAGSQVVFSQPPAASGGSRQANFVTTYNLMLTAAPTLGGAAFGAGTFNLLGVVRPCQPLGATACFLDNLTVVAEPPVPAGTYQLEVTATSDQGAVSRAVRTVALR